MDSPANVTRLLDRWSGGDSAAFEQLVPIVYGELHRLAGSYLRMERPGHTLQPTALVNEVYLKLAGQQDKSWRNRGHFLAVCAQILRQVLVDHARGRRAAKRNHGVAPLDLESASGLPIDRDTELIALNDALAEFAAIDPLKAKIVDLRYFGGFTVEEIAEMLEISSPTVKRHWAIAKAWLYNQLNRAGE